MGSSRTRAQTHVPCTGKRILNHCATREVPHLFLIVLLPWSPRTYFSPWLSVKNLNCSTSFWSIFQNALFFFSSHLPVPTSNPRPFSQNFISYIGFVLLGKKLIINQFVSECDWYIKTLSGFKWILINQGFINANRSVACMLLFLRRGLSTSPLPERVFKVECGVEVCI